MYPKEVRERITALFQLAGSDRDRIELCYVEGTLSEVSRLNLLPAVHLPKRGLQTNSVKDPSNTTRSDSTRSCELE